MFNLQHAMLRNAVERIFGIFKHQFPILTKPVEYPAGVQCRVVIALAVIHNLIMQDGVHHYNDFPEPAGVQHDKSSNVDDSDEEDMLADREEHLAWRDGIAKAMWIEYTSYNNSRGRAVIHRPRARPTPRRSRGQGNARGRQPRQARGQRQSQTD